LKFFELSVIIVASADVIGITMSEFSGYGQEHEETMRLYTCHIRDFG
jgi:hypothetical protein